MINRTALSRANEGCDEQEKGLDDFARSGRGGLSCGAMGGGDGAADFLVSQAAGQEGKPVFERRLNDNQSVALIVAPLYSSCFSFCFNQLISLVSAAGIEPATP